MSDENEQYYFDPDDKFGRLRYAEFIESIILNHNKYKRADGTSSYVLAINSPWGTGKSYFISMLKNYLEGSVRKGQIDPQRVGKIRVIKYNAWENDFWDNAIEPLMHSVLNSDIFDHPLDEEYLKEAGINILKAVAALAASIKLAPIKTMLGVDSVDKSIGYLEHGVSNIKNLLTGEIDLFPEYQQYQKNLNLFKSQLTSFVNLIDGDKSRQFVFIIDELDRCKPTFAIQTLEVVKHLFDVENIVFIFSVDINQLSCSVKSVYGQDFDSTGYLCRFFDYITQMVPPNTKKYIEQEFSGPEDFQRFTIDLAELLKLTLRDIQTIAQNYKIMCDVFLNKYTAWQVHGVYLFFLVLKYKRSDLYYDFFLNKNMILNKEPLFNFANNTYRFIMELANLFTDSCPLEDVTWNLVNANQENVVVQSIEANVVKFYVGTKNSMMGTNVSLEKVNCNNIFFGPDFAQWEDIKGMTFLSYIHRQLEMFNFDKP